MNLKFLGDKKDEFKWDYLDFLTESLNIALLNIFLMETLPRERKKWETGFPAKPEILKFCGELWECGKIGQIRALPKRTGAGYAVELHREGECFEQVSRQKCRENYFSGFSGGGQPQVIFLDPDTGFAPDNGDDPRRVGCLDVERILGQTDTGKISSRSVVVVYQDLNRKSPQKFFSEIREKFSPEQITAVYWGGGAMFFAFGKPERINEVRRINRAYQKLPRPVQTLD